MKKTVEVRITVEVEIPDNLLTEEAMANFRLDFYDFKTPEDHIKHLAQLNARGLANEYNFIEGYGEPKKLGIKFGEINEIDCEVIA